MASQLMTKELEHIQKMIDACRGKLSQQLPPNLVDGFRIGWHESKLKSLKDRRTSAWNWQKSGLDKRISETEERLRHIKLNAASDTSQREELLSRAVSEHLQYLEQIYAELAACLPVSDSLGDIEEQIKSTNENIVVNLRTYDQATEACKQMKANNDARNRESEQSLLGGLLNLAFDPLFDEEWLKNIATFAGLRLYKFVTYSDDLQNKRDDCISEYLIEAAKWNNLKLKAEIRKRKSERDAIPTVSLPRVDLFSVHGFPLNDPFERQRQFLDDIISEFNQPKEVPAHQGKSEREQREERVRKLRADRGAAMNDPELDPHERQIRINMYDDKIEDELEKIRELI
jgi:hypothetical protein